MTRSDPQSHSQIIHAGVLCIEHAFIDNQSQCAIHGGTRSFPGWTERSGFRTAAKTGPEACQFRCGRRGKIADIRRPGLRRADGAAIDFRCADRGEKPPVIFWIACNARPVTFGKLQRHGMAEFSRLRCTGRGLPSMMSESGEREACMTFMVAATCTSAGENDDRSRGQQDVRDSSR